MTRNAGPLWTFATAAVRAWTRAYTWHLRPDLRARRLAEIESDLWEFEQDPDVHRGLSPAWHVIVRLLRGIPHDLCWRVEQADAARSLTHQRLAGAAAMSATLVFVVAALWILPLLGSVALPRPQASASPLCVMPPPKPCLPLETSEIVSNQDGGRVERTWPKTGAGS